MKKGVVCSGGSNDHTIVPQSEREGKRVFFFLSAADLGMLNL